MPVTTTMPTMLTGTERREFFGLLAQRGRRLEAGEGGKAVDHRIA